jgi:helicase required for RNAi-mediated heterochromatin assembly 1
MAKTNINQIVEVLKEHIYREYEASEDLESWRKLPEIPAAGEIVGGLGRNDKSDYSDDDCLEDIEKNLPDLPVNVINGPWQNVESYVGTHYKLLREDAIAPLRKAVALFGAQPMMSDTDDVSIYTHVRPSYLDTGDCTDAIDRFTLLA